MPTTRRIALLAAASAALLAPAADASPRTTTWFTIAVPPSAQGPADTVLDAPGGGRVHNRALVAGTRSQQWTPVHPDWPAPPRVTSSSASWACAIPFVLCGYEPAARPRLQKVVNRATGRCLTLVRTGGQYGFLEPCAYDGGATQRRQTFAWSFLDSTVRAGGVPRTPTVLAQRVGQTSTCLTTLSSQADRNAEFIPCMQGGHVRQTVRFLPAAQVACDAAGPSPLCGTRRG